MITPLKLREAVLRARAEGRSYDETARLLGIGRATVNRILRLHRETSSLEPRPRGGGNTSPIHGEMARMLAAIVAEMPDATVAELASELVKRSRTQTSRSAVQRALTRLGFSRKKSRFLPPNATHSSTANSEKRSARS
ncbi:helix-turn-helix domain-containing protein [Pendulispora albinea]|uniref:helix-turn-helix domain-containing protein n=1 Tax=Pendulispora albinea TaxID=2741071 RepID=UPI00374E154B